METPLDYAVFQDHGYKGLYGGLGAKDLHSRRGLKKSDKILDHMGSTELAANLFAPHRPKKNCGATAFKGRPKPTRPTLK